MGRGWNFTALPYSESQPIDVIENCYAIMFTNIGDTIATLNGMIVYPGTPGTSLGDSRTLSGHWLDIFKGNLRLAFDAVTPGTDPNVEIVQFFYTTQVKIV